MDEPSLCESVCDASGFAVYIVYRVAVGLMTSGASELGRQFSTYENWKRGIWGNY